jgi:CBS domain-containing protein
MKKLTLTLGDVMTKQVFVVRANETAHHAAMFMSSKEIGCLVVMEDNMVVGIVTERDLINRVIVSKKNPEETIVRDIMSKPPVVARPELSVEDAVKVMFANRIKKLIVVEGDEKDRCLVGLVTLTDIARVNPSLIDLLKSFFENENEVPPKRIEKTIRYYIV